MDEVQARGFHEFMCYVNPMLAQRAQLGGEPWHVVATDDGRLVHSDGRIYEDFHGTQALGHRNPHITAAVKCFLDTDAPNWYPARVTPYAGRLARMLAERTGYERSSFAASGSEGVEAAMKLARAATHRTRILGLDGAYHGCGMGSTALMAKGPFRDPFGPHVPGVESLPFGDLDALHAAFAAGDVAAVVVEPIQGEAGVRVLPDDYVAALCELTARHDALLVADEVQTGLGRTGTFLRSVRWPRRPDAVVLAKLLGGGLVATSAMLTTPAWFQRAYGRDFEGGESHNVTFGYNAMSMVAGIAALELLDEALFERIRTLGAWFRAELVGQLGDHPLVEEVRGEGLMLGLKLRRLDHPWLSFEHFGFEGLAERASVSPLLCHRLYRHGWFFFTCGHDWSVFRLQPRYYVPQETLAQVIVDIRTELDWLLETSR
ncbi:MAG: aminotransferase class III-fold pyridoxal phosphate-dependent enzyme [Pseudomonadota bacterium]|nr:aminotransferase class III-fold pyridoxal phosphate-dependent enzyme [Pseudomonadota bacterium]